MSIRDTAGQLSKIFHGINHSALRKLKQKADSDNLAGMAKFGMAVEKRLGVSVPNIRLIAKEIGRDHVLALALWKTGVAEARIVASIIADPDRITEEQAEQWVKTFNSWDICDQVCQNLFDKTSWGLAEDTDVGGA